MESFLKNPRNSLFREAMFRHHLMHEIYTTCAQSRKNTHIYQPEIDVSGFDLVIDDLMNTLRFQLKSVMASSSTRSWDIHKILLRPDIHSLNSLPFIKDGSGLGYMGGVILIEGSVHGDQVSYQYRYTDVMVICAINKGIAAPASQKSRALVEKTFKELVRQDYKPDVIQVPKAVFWKFPSLAKLLQFAGFNVDSTNPIRHNLHRALSQLYHCECRDKLTPDREKTLAYAKRSVEDFLK